MKMKLTTPPLMQSKLLCVSVLYASSTAFFALYISLQPTKCFFRSSPFDPVQSPLFSYPPSYGEHKYAIPTHRTTCSSPVKFSDYWLVVKEVEDYCKGANDDTLTLRYASAKLATSDTFGGNFSTENRISYFDHSKFTHEIACGFFKPFPISTSDQIAMERCRGVVVVSAIFNDHDKIRQPKSIGSKTFEIVCFFMFVDDVTFQGLNNHQLVSTNSMGEHTVGVWRIVKVSTKTLYKEPAMNGVIPKYLLHRLFPNSKFSIWVDAKLQLLVDPLLLIHSFVVSKKVDMAISMHPFFVHTMEEAVATARWRKWWDADGLRKQMETYCENGMQPWSTKKLPYPSDVPDSALILRKHGGGSNLFSCLMFNELDAFNHRDQLAFAYVRDKMRGQMMVKMFMFEVEVFEQIAVEYRHNLKAARQSPMLKRVSHDSFVNSSKCHTYLLHMWGDSQN